jgi:dipeptidyl aminopeptidase/acylaminoacyl peptidase
MQYWCGKGFAVLFCNPTGSDGRGETFADLRGHYGETDYRDIMSFVDTALAQNPWIDAEHVGVTGGSYGGFMTNWIVGHTQRFKAAATQRSITNWLGFNLTSDIGYTFGEDQTGGTPWNNFEGLWRQSPGKYLDQATTPLLVIHSEEDYRCYMADGIQIFYALKQKGVDARMVLFKGENHELSRSGKPKNRVRRLQEITEWMEKYLKV